MNEEEFKSYLIDRRESKCIGNLNEEQFKSYLIKVRRGLTQEQSESLAKIKWSKAAVRKGKINSKFINSPTVQYYRAKFKQSDLDMYFKCNDPKCERFGKRTPYDTILEMYSEYAPIPCCECDKKMIVTLERLPNEPRNIDIQMGYLGKDRYGDDLK